MKIRTITRTIVTRKATVLMVNPVEQSFVTAEFVLSADADEKNALEMVKELVPAEVIPVKLVSLETSEKLYSMPESVFLMYATPVDSRCTKKEKESE